MHFVSRWYNLVFNYFFIGVSLFVSRWYIDDFLICIMMIHGVRTLLYHGDTNLIFILSHDDTVRVLTDIFMLYNFFKKFFWLRDFDKIVFVSPWYKYTWEGVVSRWYKAYFGIVSWWYKADCLICLMMIQKGGGCPQCAQQPLKKKIVSWWYKRLFAFVFFLPLFKEREDDILHLFLGVVFREVLRNGF